MDSVAATRIHDLLASHAAHGADREAAVDGSLRLSYGQLAAQVDKLARAMLASGIRRGDRVATLGPPSILFWETYLAAVSIGAIWHGLNPRYKGPEYVYLLNDARPRLVFVHSPYDGRAYAAELSALPSPVEEFIACPDPIEPGPELAAFLERAGQCSEEALEAARAAVEPEDIAVIVYTSGTTGRPKGAMLSHRAIVASAQANAGWGGDGLETTICAAPINHVGALNNVCMSVLAWGGAIIFYHRVDLKAILELSAVEQATYLVASPMVFVMLHGELDPGLRLFAGYRLIVFGGAKTARHLLEPVMNLGPRLAAVYGQTETCGIVTMSDPGSDIEVLSETIGKPLPGATIRICHADGREAEIGEIGEIQVKGPYVMSGYFGRPEATVEAFTADGFLRTGDLGFRRVDGNFVCSGRLKEMFKSGGYNIFPSEIEQAICEHPDVLNAAVLPVPHELYQEVGHAFVAPMPGHSLSEQGLKAFLRERLANYKIPKSFTFEAALPTLVTHKIDKQALKRRLESERGAS
jgi:acyl-CoA synthetase (AMP-forming)/AMP-acid ligase II